LLGKKYNHPGRNNLRYKEIDVIERTWEFSLAQPCPFTAETNVFRYSEVF